MKRASRQLIVLFYRENAVAQNYAGKII